MIKSIIIVLIKFNINMATAPSGTPSKWFMEEYFFGFIAGIMDFENIDDAKASSSTTCLD